MKRWNTVAVIGVGLMGGSVGLALRRRRLAARVVGIGRSEASLREALDRGAADDVTTNLEEGVRGADLVVVCSPVASIVDHVRRAASAAGRSALITDVGSTKEQIVQAVGRDVLFVGSHPLAGSEKQGPRYAQAELLQDRVVVVTPEEWTPPDAIGLVSQFWTSLGAAVVSMSPAAHDEAVAVTSHLPHVLAAALAASTPREQLHLVASGWLDTTRVASGDVHLWQQILQENRHHVLKSLDEFAKVLDSFRAAIGQDSGKKILELLQAGKERRDAVGNRHSSGQGPA
jgi:prephenate dehydrogenase